jgi:hypothetical protein
MAKSKITFIQCTPFLVGGDFVAQNEEDIADHDRQLDAANPPLHCERCWESTTVHGVGGELICGDCLEQELDENADF